MKHSHLAIFSIFYLLSACSPDTEYRCSGFTGLGGGGSGGGQSSTWDPFDPVECEPVAAFSQPDVKVCFEPCHECCDYSADLAGHCYVASDGTMPHPYLCSESPGPQGPSTDGRPCIEVAPLNIPCQWGSSFLLCCAPLDM